MLYGNESISQYSRSNVIIWMSMAFQAGVINIGGFLACHRFVSHITGFATFFGVEISHPEQRHPGEMLIVPLFFLAGSMISGVLVDLRLRLHKKPKYYIAFGIIFIILLGVFLAGIFGFLGPFGESHELLQNRILLVVLCLVCGIQNGTITSVSKSVVRTTHLTGITTDLGIGLIRFYNRRKLGSEVSHEGKANIMRIGIITFFGLGSAVGGFLFKKLGFYGFFIPVTTSGILLMTMLIFKIAHLEAKVLPSS